MKFVWGFLMIIHTVAEIGKTHWVIQDPYETRSFSMPFKAKLLKAEYIVDDDIPCNNKQTYFLTYIFDNGIHIPLYNTGLKTGHKLTKGYYITKTSNQILQIMYRIAYPEKCDMEVRVGFNYNKFRDFLNELIKKYPEMLI